jgi:hypothetical protein
MSRPGFEPGPPAWEASTLEKSHLDSLSAIRNLYLPVTCLRLSGLYNPLVYFIHWICPCHVDCLNILLATLRRYELPL